VSSAEAMEALGHPISWRIANDYAAMQGAALGQPVVLGQPKSKLSRDIRLIARQLAGVPVPSRRTSLLPWLRRGASLVTA
jgi:MinD-like ATPase involved in chromosome partitioning or flagellar assembly